MSLIVGRLASTNMQADLQQEIAFMYAGTDTLETIYYSSWGLVRHIYNHHMYINATKGTAHLSELTKSMRKRSNAVTLQQTQ